MSKQLTVWDLRQAIAGFRDEAPVEIIVTMGGLCAAWHKLSLVSTNQEIDGHNKATVTINLEG